MKSCGYDLANNYLYFVMMKSTDAGFLATQGSYP